VESIEEGLSRPSRPSFQLILQRGPALAATTESSRRSLRKRFPKSNGSTEPYRRRFSRLSRIRVRGSGSNNSMVRRMIRLLLTIGFASVSVAAHAAHSPSVLADPEGAAEGGWRMYDPSGILKGFKLQAHPEACIGTPESIEASGHEAARRTATLSNGPRPPLQLTPEPVPPGTPVGWRGFRFTEGSRVFLGTVCGVIYDQETETTVFVMRDSSPRTHSSQASFTTRQDGPTLFESHILIPPNGYVSPELIVSD